MYVSTYIYNTHRRSIYKNKTKQLLLEARNLYKEINIHHHIVYTNKHLYVYQIEIFMYICMYICLYIYPLTYVHIDSYNYKQNDWTAGEAHVLNLTASAN